MTMTALDISRLPRTALAPRPHREVLETARLMLRAPDEQDIVAMTALAGNPRVADGAWRMPQPYTLADAGRFLRRSRDSSSGLSAFAITLGDTGAFIGCVKMEAGSDETERQIGFWLGEQHWNRGLMTEAMQALTDHAFEGAARLLRIVAHVHVNALAARRVLEKGGFQYAGPAAETDFRRGAMIPADRYAIDRGIWTALKAWSHRH